MNTAAIKRLLTILSSKAEIERTRLYQLVDLAELCYCLKDAQGQREIGLLLQEFPPPFNLLGDYYEAIYLNQVNLFDEAKSRLERVYEHGPAKYRAKALLSLGAVEQRSGNLDEAMRLRLQASKLDIPSVTIESQIGIASLLGAYGDHRQAVKYLEQFLPLARMINRGTPLYYDYLNSFAVELNDSGRTEEARNVINLVLSTPYVKHYPNWLDTENDIHRKSYRSSMVSMPKVRFEKAIERPEPKQAIRPASVIAFKLKEAPEPKKPDKLSPRDISELSSEQKRELVLAAIRTGSYTPFDYDRFLVMVGLLEIGPSDKILDLEDEEILDDVAVIWANHVEPDNFAAVLSALRDCEDRSRRNEIIDRMIKKAFQQTHQTRMSEEAWRLEVERRLPEK
jgi:tetratricopeptide (TPR) repeat protein